MRYRESNPGVELVATKFDGFTIKVTGKDYKNQKESGRAKVFALLADGIKVGDWLKKCAAIGYGANFCVGSMRKHITGKEPAFVFSATDDKGNKFEDVATSRKHVQTEAQAKAAAEKAAKAKAAKAAKAGKPAVS